MKYYIEIDERDIDRFRIDNPCKGSHGNDVLVLKDKNNLTIGFELLKERPHGEWEGHVERKNLNTRKCTSCGEYGAVGYFCMWCGADMMREGDEK